VWISKKIWFRKNTVVHWGLEFLHPNIVVRGAVESFEEEKKANVKESDQLKETRVGSKKMESSSL